MDERPDRRAALQAALQDYSSRAKQASNRLDAIQRLVRDELAERFAALGDLAEVRLEQSIRGKHRSKNWDVVFSFGRRQQFAVSTKAIISNVGGTVPNRIDDAMGECVNVHAHDPGVVLGYLFVMDAQGGGQMNSRERRPWVDVFADALLSFSGRRSERDEPELFEAATLLVVDFSRQPPAVTFQPRLLDWDQFFSVLVGQVRARNPLIDRGLALDR